MRYRPVSPRPKAENKPDARSLHNPYTRYYTPARTPADLRHPGKEKEKILK